MASSAQGRIFRLAAISAAMAIAAVVVPRFVPSGEGGLAAAATAALVFFALLVGAAAVALAALAVSLRNYAALPWLVRAVGIAPAVVLGTALLWIVMYLSY